MCVCVTCELAEAADWKTTSSRHKLQQTSAMFVVQLSQELQQASTNQWTDKQDKQRQQSILTKTSYNQKLNKI